MKTTGKRIKHNLKKNRSLLPEKHRFNSIWAGLQVHLKELLYQIIKPGSKAVFLDFPVYTNIGDLMIYLGTEIWLKQHPVTVLGRWHINNFFFPKIDKDFIILLQGGGNFSDLYSHQSFREKVVSHYPENRIVFLPQSIFFKNELELQKSASFLSCHHDLHILIRDHLSMKKAKQHLSKCQLYLAPDMSVFLYPLENTLVLKRGKSKNGHICLARSDIENAGQPPGNQEETWRGDWKNLLGWRIVFVRIFQLISKFNIHLLPKLYVDMWLKTAKYLVYYCANYFNQSKQISSSRLHGHILASLLSIQNELYDNISNKNSSYFETWHKDLPMARLCKY